MILAAGNNPLRTEVTENIPFRFESGDWNSHLQLLEQLKFRAAIVGPQGSGKTTLLAELQSHLKPAAHYLNLPHHKTHHAKLLTQAEAAADQGAILLVDGIERITWWQRERLYFATAGKAGLVVVVHSRCRLPTWIRCRTSETLMYTVICDLGLDKPDVQTAARIAYRNAGGNIRDALRNLYNLFADQKLAATASSVKVSNRLMKQQGSGSDPQQSGRTTTRLSVF